MTAPRQKRYMEEVKAEIMADLSEGTVLLDMQHEAEREGEVYPASLSSCLLISFHYFALDFTGPWKQAPRVSVHVMQSRAGGGVGVGRSSEAKQIQEWHRVGGFDITSMCVETCDMLQKWSLKRWSLSLLWT